MTYFNPYKVIETDTGMWRVMLHDKPVGFGILDFKNEDQADLLCNYLNEALRNGYNLGWDAGQEASMRQHLRG
jgi:hypothetical protein